MNLNYGDKVTTTAGNGEVRKYCGKRYLFINDRPVGVLKFYRKDQTWKASRGGTNGNYTNSSVHVTGIELPNTEERADDFIAFMDENPDYAR